MAAELFTPWVTLARTTASLSIKSFLHCKDCPRLITTFTTCKKLLSSYKHSTHPLCCLDLIILPESHVTPSKGLAEEMDERKRDEKKFSKGPSKRLRADSSPLEHYVPTGH